MRLRRRRQQWLGTDRAANWPRLAGREGQRPRVLLEVKDPADAFSYLRFLGSHGYEVSWCPGPTASTSCVLVTEGRCPLHERADIVLTALDPDDPYALPVLERLHEECAGKPTLAVAPVAEKKRWSACLERFTVLNPFQVRKELLPALAVAESRCRKVQTS